MAANKIGANIGSRGRGRPKGSPNKNTAALKDMILNALDKAGGEDYLITQAEDNPTAFMTLIGKVLPTTLAGDVNVNVKLASRFAAAIERISK